ncbi:DUF1493 family protein [Pedobacter sp. PWIIR3]
MKSNIASLNEIQFGELIAFIRTQIREDVMPITRETLIENDLGVTGDEAEELIKSFAKKFNVNIDCFEFASYFYDEPSFIDLPNRIVKPFTIKYLETAIIEGRLDEEIINMAH